jgi:hypothetical protein
MEGNSYGLGIYGFLDFIHRPVFLQIPDDG